jgi:methylamine dehydrogenase accessory protein MauD
MDALTVSVVLLWAAVIALAVLLWALSRQVGVLFERVAPMGALMTDAGPAVGSASPNFALRGIQSEAVNIGGTSDKASLLFFLSPTCPVCKKLIPVLKALVRDERRGLAVVLASDGEEAEHLRFLREQGLEALPYVLSTELGMMAAKGLVNSREQLDSLLNAHELRSPSIQHYLGGKAA